MEIKKLLELKKAIKKRKPTFIRRDAHKISRLPFGWKRPRGRHSPVRQGHRGKQNLVSIGYGSPKEIRHFHPSGRQKVTINNKKELEKINPEKQGVIISAGVGNRKRAEIIKLALEKKILIFNFEPKKQLEKIESLFKERKESKKKKLTEKEKKESEKKKKAEEKEKKELEKEKEEKPMEETQKEKKEEEKKEMEKTIIKKQ